ncbi:hypothetical protein FACS1894199_13280 [Bacteroidia bacterium]|nr:hypothetical protein FACS1894199_13280 [Bacteroidia bacterium]
MQAIDFHGIGIIKLRQTGNIKYLTLRMAPGRGVWVNVPRGVSGAQVARFIDANKEWLTKNLPKIQIHDNELSDNAGTDTNANTGTDTNGGKLVKTKLHTLQVEQTKEKKPFYQLKDRLVTVFIPENTDKKGRDIILKNFSLILYRKECDILLPERVKEFAGKFGFNYKKLSFRNNVSNWGSCTYDNKISLNINLMRVPDEVIDYVIIHELCHTVEKNHSPRFWKLVEERCPDYKRKRAELKKYSCRL